MTEEQNKLAEEIERLIALSEKGRVSIQAAEGTEETSFERAAAFADETYFRAELATWFRANLAALREPATDAVLDMLRLEVLDIAARECSDIAWLANSDKERAVAEKCAATIRALKGKGASQGAEGDYSAAIVKAALIATDPKSPSGNVPIDWARLRTACEKYRAASPDEQKDKP